MNNIEIKLDEKFKDELVGANPHIHSIAILTAENPLAHNLSKQINNERMKKLEIFLKNKNQNEHILFRKMLGKFGNIERSFMISNITQKEAEEIATRYKQVSFIVGKLKD